MAPITSRIWAIWFLINAMYYGQLVVMPFMLGKTTKSFLGYFLTLMGEAPSIIVSLYIVDVPSLGRKNSLVLTLMISTIFHVLCYVISKKHVSFIASSARFFMKQSFAMLYPFTAESYPTLMRTIGFGWASGIGRIGATIVPFIMFSLIEYDVYSSFLLFAVFSAFGVWAAITLPFDTMGRSLDDKVESKPKADGENPLINKEKMEVELGKK